MSTPTAWSSGAPTLGLCAFGDSWKHAAEFHLFDNPVYRTGVIPFAHVRSQGDGHFFLTTFGALRADCLYGLPECQEECQMHLVPVAY